MMNTTRKPENKFRHRLKELGLGGLPPVPPIPDLSMYKKDKYENSVLLHHKPSYRLQQQRSSRIQTTHSSFKYKLTSDSCFQPLKTGDTHKISLDFKAGDTGQKAVLYNQNKYCQLPPLSESWILRILQKVPVHFDVNNKELKDLLNEVHELYKDCLTNLTVQQMLGSSTIKTTKMLSLAPIRDNYTGGPRAKYFLKYQKEIRKRLFLLDPSLRCLLSLCKDVLGSMIILDIKPYRSFGPLDCANLLEMVKKDCSNAEDKVLHGWFPKVVGIVSTPSKQKSQSSCSMAYYKCVTSILSAQLKELVHRSLQSVVDVYTCDNNAVIFPILKITLKLQNDTIVSNPTLHDFEILISEIIKQMITTLIEVPTVDSWLSDGAVTMMETTLPETVIQNAIDEIITSIRNQFRGPQSLIDVLIKKYDNLINGQAKQRITTFLSIQHEFEKYCEMIDYYDDLSFFIDTLPNIEYFPMFAVSCSEIKEILVQAAKNHRNYVLDFVAKQNKEINLKVCKMLARMKGRMKKIPNSISEMVNLKTYVQKVEADDVLILEKEVKASYNRLSYLLRLYEFNEDDVILNGYTLTIPGQIGPLIKTCKETLEDCKLRFDEDLQNRIEKLSLDIEKLQVRIKDLEDCGSFELVTEFTQDVRSIERRIKELQETIKQINDDETLFGFPLSTYPDLEDVITNVNLFRTLFGMVTKWQKTEKQWMDGNFRELDSEVIELNINNFNRDLHKLQKVFRARQKQQEGDGKRSVRWGEDKMEGEAVSPSIKLCLTTLDKVREFKMHLPIINTLCRPGIRPRHWQKMHKLIGYQLMPDSGGSLRMILQYDLYPHLEKLETVTISAAKEYAMEKAIRKLLHEWDHVKFTTVMYRDTGAAILTALDEVQFALDDHVIKIQTMRASPFIQPFEEDVQKWESKLLRTQETIDEWLKVQSQWMYLEPIFSSKDIVQQMPKEGNLFFTVDQNWRSIMKIVARDPKVMSTAGDEDMLETLRKNTVLLDQINQGLNDYLEQKRLYFPRFFFLSNDEMLEILSETRDPLRVQPHLKKCFEGVAKLEFDELTMNIRAMFSSEGERVELTEGISTIETKGQVEKWLLRVQEVMQHSVKDSIRKARLVYPTVQLKDWVIHWPGQTVLCVSQLFWTSKVHGALCCGTESALKNYLTVIDSHIADVVKLIRGQLELQARITLNSFVVIEVHARDVVASLLKKGISSSNDFDWLSQLRYYWENDECHVCITNAIIRYSYEYLGNTPRLVITPLTDRCYRTLIGAFHLNLNGSLEGPAGTGKTETVKDLAKALAVHCVVFNCSEGLNYLAMGKFFKGLASSGAWACFDEFNRIDLEVLSVVAQQILTIMQAVRAKLSRFVFEGTEIQLNHNCFTCITQNPGYAGRTELPDNLKALFRTMAMMVPNYVMIAEIVLYSYGFIDARNQATKIVTTYRLCSEQLSSQSHYDYGMRAVKTVLSTAGLLKLRYPDEKEEILVLRSIVDVNLPKFLPHDIPLFEGIVSDLFPGVKLPNLDYLIFLEIANEVCESLYLLPNDVFMQKLIQVYETMMVRHGFMLVGETLGGKTRLLEVLAKTLTLMHKRNLGNIPGQVICHVVNPMAITMGQLYGQFDPASREWTDGVVAKIFRDIASSTNMDYKWIIFDGPVDTMWIENMNAVLDDNKKLCLMSGEIIPMSPTMSVIFEVMDLQSASPATVSRCGMVYVEPKSLGWEPLVESWIKRISSSENHIWLGGHDKFVHSLCYWMIGPSLTFVQKHCKEVIATTDSHQALSFLRLVEGLLNDACQSRRDIEVKYNRFWILGAFAFSLVWSIGASCDAASRPKFSAFMRQHLSGKSTYHPIPAEVGKFDITFPSDGLVYDYVYEFQQKGQWKHWNDFLWSLESEMDNSTNVWQLLVPTVETVRCNYLVDASIKQNIPMLFVGPTGTGKSAHVKNKLLKNLSKDKYVSVFVLFSAQTSASQVQDIILSNLDKRRKGVYGPPVNKNKCLVFLDDIHLPSREASGCQPSLELLRQYFDHHFWYDRKDQSKMNLLDLVFLATLGISGVADDSQNGISPRILRHFNMIALNPFGNDTLRRVFTSTLNHHYRMGCFPVDTFAVIPNIVSATMSMYKAVTSHLLPTPQKFFYLFNLRDMARVILGCCLIRKDSISNKRTFSRLWTHEVLRVFYDRLVDDEDRRWLYEQLRDCIQTHFKDNVDLVFEHLGNKNRKISENDLRNLLFGDYMQSDMLPEDRRYEEVLSLDMYQHVVQNAVEEYNNTNKARVDIVIFPYVLEHLSRICRVLRIPGGHCLLIGANGCGRQTLTRLAASMSGFTLFQPDVTKNYGRVEWKEDIKSMLRCIGIQGRPTVFLVTDSHIKQECFLEDIDSLLNSGEVPNLFQTDEKQEIFQAMRSATGTNTAHNLSCETNSTLAQYAAFVARCQENLHLVIALSPQSSAFRHRLRQFPSLIHCCTIDWFQPWPADALESVAQHYLRPLKLDKFGRGKEEVVVKVCEYFHVTTRNLASRILDEERRHVYVTPTTFLHLLDTLSFLLSSKENELKTARKRYVAGLEKLVFASSQVTEMQEELRLLQPQLIESASKARRMMMIIESETQEVETKRSLLQEDEATANIQAAEAKSLRDECESDLAEALPALEAAIASLDTLKPADITVLKSMKNPPPAVKLVMEAVCVMMDVKPVKITDPGGSGAKVFDYWGPSKKILGDLNFLSKLKEYNKDSIPSTVIAKISKDFLPNPEFKPNIVAKASSAAEGLCKWVCAMELYDRTAKIVAPKKVKLLEADDKLSELMTTLEEKRKELTVIEKHLFELEQHLNETMEEKSRLENQTELCALKLRRAKDLIDGLGDEKDRWNNEAELLNNTLNHLLGDILLAAGTIAYLGPFTSSYRATCIQEWTDFLEKQHVETSDNFSLSRTLGDPLIIQTWTIAGLPNDAFSIDNAVMIHHTRKWPVMIDPQGQACKWIKAIEHNHLALVKPSSSNYQRIIEACIQNGRPLLIEDIGEDIDPALEPILLKQSFLQGGVEMIRFGDKLLDYNSDFRLMMTTKLHNPHYPPEFAVKVCLVNFQITMEGLEDQLLGILVAKERPDLECEHRDFVIQSSKNKFALKELEDKILETLSASEGNILEDETAIQVLDSSKHLAVEIITKQRIAEETEKLITESRQSYQPVAKHSAVLFFCLTGLSNIDSMYHYSLAWFVHLFNASIDHSEKSNFLSDRLQNLMSHFTHNVYVNVCRSLFEKHKSIFSFMLCCKLLMAREDLNKTELMFFLTGGIGLLVEFSNPVQDWLPDQAWQELCRLSQLPNFVGLQESFIKFVQQWHYYFNSDCQSERLPEPWRHKLTDFQSLCVVRCLRPDRVIPMLNNFIQKHLGKQFMKPPQFNLNQSYVDSTARSPLLYLLSPGTDPLCSLQRFSAQKGYSENRLHIISLGQGQGRVAEQAIEKARVAGDWVLLQNCHLAISWLPTLEIICERLQLEETHPDFRLWLTSYPSEKFPVSLLQNSIKMTNEPPAGLKQCLLRVYQDEPIKNPEFFNSCPGKDKTFRRLLFAVSFFHALISERRKYGSMGWNIAYGFNDSDLAISLQQLQMFVEQYATIPFDALTYMIGECNYGGRVTDEWDRRILMTTLTDICNENVLSDDKFKISSDGTYFIPTKSSYEEYLQHIEELPSEQDSEVFGLHQNVDISRNLQDSRFLWDAMLLTEGHGFRAKGTEISDNALYDITTDILRRLPENFDLDATVQRYPLSYGDSMNTVLVQEMKKYNQLLSVIRNSLKALEKAVKGLVMMTAELEMVAGTLIIGKIPPSWSTVSYPSLKPLGSYINDLLARIQFLDGWFHNGLPAFFWLPGFFFTQAFLTAVLQNHARKYSIPIDKLEFDFKVMHFSETQEPPSDGAYISGLYLEGAQWDHDRRCLSEQKTGVLWDLVPIIWLLPSMKECVIEDGRYPCPLYKTRERKGALSTTGHSTNYVLSILLTTDKPVKHWIKRGTALICQLDT